MTPETKPVGDQIIPGLGAGLVVGIVDVIYAISLAALIFGYRHNRWLVIGYSRNR